MRLGARTLPSGSTLPARVLYVKGWLKGGRGLRSKCEIGKIVDNHASLMLPKIEVAIEPANEQLQHCAERGLPAFPFSQHPTQLCPHILGEWVGFSRKELCGPQ
jgi:hypothetical protein